MKIAIVGCGVMGQAFAHFFAKKHQVYLVAKDPSKVSDLSKKIHADILSLNQAVESADIIFLAIKPKDLASVVSKLTGMSFQGKTVISILTGLSVPSLQKDFPKAYILRTMPNLAFSYGKGIMGVVEDTDPKNNELASHLFEGMGLIYFLPENKVDAFTAVCGSSPAFIFVILEAMMEGAVGLGFSFHDAQKLVLQAFEGALAMAKDSGKHLAELKMSISSPGGTTIAGLKEMELRGVRSGLIHTLVACYQRAQEMSRMYQKP
jgi:pyrroline-5-carboxylate reductase